MASKRTRKEKVGSFQPSGEVKRIVPLGDGEWAYLFDAKGKTHHLKRDSEEFVARCIENEAVLPGKYLEPLNRLGWTDVIGKIEALSSENQPIE